MFKFLLFFIVFRCLISFISIELLEFGHEVKLNLCVFASIFIINRKLNFA